MSKSFEKTVASALGAAVVGSLLVVGTANAAGNPFALKELDHGSMLLASAGQGGCNAKPGDMGNTHPGQSGASHASGMGNAASSAAKKTGAAAGHCAVSKKQAAEGMCGSST